MLFKKEMVELLKKEIPGANEDQIGIPPRPEMGDFAFPCFEIAKASNKNPAEFAKGLAETLNKEKPDFVEKVNSMGPFLNFFIKKSAMAERVLKKISQEPDYGSDAGATKKYLSEYPGPNTNKPLHLGHLRNMFLGDSLTRILKFTKNKVIVCNINNDRGIHICKSMLAYQKFGQGDSPEKSGMKSDHFVGKYYVIFAQKSKDDPELEKEAYDILRKWEENDPETRKLWKKMNDWAFKGFDVTYKKLGISFDKQYYESKHYDKGKDLMLDALKKGIFKKDDEGNIIADLEAENLGFKVVLRADGTAVYMTQDVQLAKMKFEEFNPDLSIYVVASEQNHHFKQLFSILKMLGFPFAEKNYHMSYGMVFLPEGKMKSREGTVVDADDLIEEVIALAKAEITVRHKDLNPDEVENRATAIGLGALRFFMLKTDPVRDMVYDPKESLSFEGETGPYVQYAHARCAAILRKYGKKPDTAINYDSLNTPEDQLLIKKLNDYPDVVKEAATHFKSSVVCRYLLELAQLLNEFYHRRKVIEDDEEKTKARILLVDSVMKTTASGLSLLGIDSPEEM